MTTTPTRARVGVEEHGLTPAGSVVWSPTTTQLYTHAIRQGDGVLATGGPLAVDTGRFTGRSPKDKFVVEESGSKDRIAWGAVNQPLDEERYDGLRAKVVAYLEGQDPLYVVDAFAGADPAHTAGAT
jgi:phosphoenolpyruvate carboxykinase (ATP)